MGRLRHGPEVPAADDAGVRSSDGGPREARRARDAHDDPRSDGLRRDLRPGRRRVRALLHRRAWHVPHFEKMLYDNAQLAQLYVRAWLLTRDDRYRRVATDTLDYLLREMHHPEGGFYSSQDADSEGVEGRFFTWTWEELVDLIGADAADAFGATPGGQLGGHERAVAPERLGAERLSTSPPRVARSSRRERPGSDPGRTTRCSPRGTRWRSRPSPKRAEHSGRPGSSRRPKAARASSWRTCAGPTGDSCAHGGMGFPDGPASAMTMRCWPRPASRSSRPRGRSTGSAKRSCSSTRWWTCSSTRSAVASSRRRIGRRAARPPTEGAVRQRRAVRELGGRRRPPAGRPPLR